MGGLQSSTSRTPPCQSRPCDQGTRREASLRSSSCPCPVHIPSDAQFAYAFSRRRTSPISHEARRLQLHVAGRHAAVSFRDSMGLWPTSTHTHGSKRAEGLGMPVCMRDRPWACGPPTPRNTRPGPCHAEPRARHLSSVAPPVCACRALVFRRAQPVSFRAKARNLACIVRTPSECRYAHSCSRREPRALPPSSSLHR